MENTLLAKKGRVTVTTTTAEPVLEMSTSSIKNMLGNVLVPLVLFLYSSGIPQMRDIMKKGDTQGYSFMPFLFLQVNAFIWTVYAFHFTGAFDAFGKTWATKSVEYFPILTPCLGFIA